MAIVINGSGTVTGISVGGLPDGIVDAGTLATNSVDSAELIDGSIDNSHIDAMAASKLTGALPAISGANLTGLTSSQMPAGSILQVVAYSTTSSADTSSTSWTATGFSASITPSTTSSKVFIIATFNAETWGAEGAIGTYTLYHDQTTNLGDASYGMGMQSGTNSTAPNYHSRAIGTLTYVHSPGSVAEADYEIYQKNQGPAGGTKVGPGRTSITLMEIAG